MEPIKKILVGLDLTKMDDTLIDFASFVTRSSPAEAIYFMHVIRSSEESRQLEGHDRMQEGSVKERKDKLEQTIEEKFRPHKKINAHIQIEVGQPSKTILNFSKEEGIDVIIVGNKKKNNGSGVITHRLARRASCKLLIIPEGHKPVLDKLLVPIDFSKYAKQALEYAIYISRSNESRVEIICQNVYEVPVGYHYAGKSYEEFAGVMKKNAEKDFKKFIADMDAEGVKITPAFSLDRKDDFAGLVKSMAKKKNVSGIIVGAKGRSSTTAIFLGNEAEKLLNAVDNLPLTVVRPKGKTAGIMEAISEI